MSADDLIARGERCETAGRLDDASALYGAAVDRAPDSGLAAYRAGRALLELGRPAEAVRFLARAVALAPDHAPTAYLLAKAHSALSDHQAALAAAGRALELDPGHAGAWLLMLRHLAAPGRWDEVRGHCAQLPGRLAQHPEIQLWCAIAGARDGRRAAGREVLAGLPAATRRRCAEQVRTLEGLLASDGRDE